MHGSTEFRHKRLERQVRLDAAVSHERDDLGLHAAPHSAAERKAHLTAPRAGKPNAGRAGPSGDVAFMDAYAYGR